jgi:hypothetical protein
MGTFTDVLKKENEKTLNICLGEYLILRHVGRLGSNSEYHTLCELNHSFSGACWKRLVNRGWLKPSTVSKGEYYVPTEVNEQITWFKNYMGIDRL